MPSLRRRERGARDGAVTDARILIVDDEEANVRLLRRILEAAGFGRLEGLTDSRRIDEVLEELAPDMVLLDLLMPHLDGFQVLERIRAYQGPGDFLPVIVLTSDHRREARKRALEEGADDFLTKPLSPTEVRLRVRNLLETRLLHKEIRGHNRLLEERVRERTEALEEARLQTLHRLARAAEYRDDQTGEHTRRVGEAAARIGAALGLGPDEVETLRLAAPLHDVGKIGIPDAILLSPRRLSPEEERVMQQHTLIGGELLESDDVPLLRKAAEIALTHHERWDGGGYPRGLSGDQIPLTGRIVAIADTFDALTHPRPYKAAWPLERALAEIRRESGGQFDPGMVEAFERARAARDHRDSRNGLVARRETPS